MSTTSAPVAETAEAELPDPEPGDGLAPEGPADAGRGRVVRALRSLVGWLAVAAGVIVLWPAQLGGIVGLTIVSGHSMEPSYLTGDLVVTVRQASYVVDDVVSYVVPEGQPGAGGRVIHRIVTAEDGVYTTLGDNNAEPDPWAFEAADVTGRALFRLSGLGTIWSPQVFPIIIAIALGGIVAVVLWPSRPETAAGEEEAPHAS